MALIYLMVVMTVLLGFCSLAVDWGHVLVVKAELQHAADTAARHAYRGFEDGVAAAQQYAADAADDNTADGSPVQLDVANDVEFGVWGSQTKTFTRLTGDARAAANAIRVTARRTAARGNAVPLMFAGVVGKDRMDVQADGIAMIVRERKAIADVPSQSNPWLAGMGAGSQANRGNPANKPDQAPGQSPLLMTGITLKPGMHLSFDSVVGAANNGPGNNGTMYSPDGNAADIVHNFTGAEHGKSDLYAPINSVVGVFLDDSMPQLSTPPPTLNFSTAASRNFTTLSPQLRQVFFIGDSRTSTGQVQTFVVPAGATRLYVGIMDAYEWNNNSGEFTVTIFQENVIGMVQ